MSWVRLRPRSCFNPDCGAEARQRNQAMRMPLSISAPRQFSTERRHCPRSVTRLDSGCQSLSGSHLPAGEHPQILPACLQSTSPHVWLERALQSSWIDKGLDLTSLCHWSMNHKALNRNRPSTISRGAFAYLLGKECFFSAWFPILGHLNMELL